MDVIAANRQVALSPVHPWRGAWIRSQGCPWIGISRSSHLCRVAGSGSDDNSHARHPDFRCNLRSARQLLLRRSDGRYLEDSGRDAVLLDDRTDRDHRTECAVGDVGVEAAFARSDHGQGQGGQGRDRSRCSCEQRGSAEEDRSAKAEATATLPRQPKPQEDPAQPPSDGLLINGSVNNAATSQFSLAPAFGNNRSGKKGLYTGGLGIILDNSAMDARPYSLERPELRQSRSTAG